MQLYKVSFRTFQECYPIQEVEFGKLKFLRQFKNHLEALLRESEMDQEDIYIDPDRQPILGDIASKVSNRRLNQALIGIFLSCVLKE